MCVCVCVMIALVMSFSCTRCEPDDGRYFKAYCGSSVVVAWAL